MTETPTDAGPIIVVTETTATVVQINDTSQLVVTETVTDTVEVGDIMGPPGPRGIAGPQGPQGPIGPQGDGVRRWYGEGPPTVVIGAAPDDEYVDNLTGDLYVLR